MNMYIFYAVERKMYEFFSNMDNVDFDNSDFAISLVTIYADDELSEDELKRVLNVLDEYVQERYIEDYVIVYSLDEL